MWACALGVTATLASGCGDSGPPRMRLRGQVTFDRKPIDKGSVILAPTNQSLPAVSGDIVAGRFDIPASTGPVVGQEYRVEISALRKTGKTVRNVMTAIVPGQPDRFEVSENYIPAKYNTRSILKVAISSDASKNEHTFELVPEPVKGKRPGAISRR
jgi:hypothetical protein